MGATRKTFLRLRGTSSHLAVLVRWRLLAPLLGVAIAPAQATDYYWDVNGILLGSGGPTPNGTWSGTDTTLSLNSAGTAAVLTHTTTTADRLFFSAGTDATGAYTVTVSGTQNIGRLTFQEGAVSLTGGTINFGAAVSGLIDGDATPDSISAVLSGTNGVRFNGGTVTLNGAAANTYAGTTQVGGAALAQARVNLSAAGGNAISGNFLQLGGGNYTSAGFVTLGAANQINDTATVQLTSGHYSGSSIFSMNGFDETLGGIGLHHQGAGSAVTFRNGAATDATVTLAGSGTYTTASGDRTFGRSIQNGGAGRLNVVVALTGTGSQTFAGTDPTYTGTTTVTSGTLRLWNTSIWASNATLNGGTLELQQTSANTGFLTGAAIRTHANTISGMGGTLRKTGNGTVILSGANTYQGATSIQAGTLQAGSTSAFGSNSAVTLANVAGATLHLNGFNNSIGSLAGGGGTGGNVILGTATLTTGGDNTSTSYAGTISGAGALTKAGSGTLSLTGANIYTGTTTVAAGTLRINGSLATSPVTANAGSTLGGIGTLGGPVTITNGATLDAGPTAGAVGTLTMGALTLNAGSQLTYDLGEANVAGGPNNDLVQVNGNLTLGGVVNVNAPGSVLANTLLPGSYRLINYTGTLSGSAAIGSIPSGFATSQIQTVVPNQVNLIAVQNGVPVQFWDGADTTGNGVLDGGTGTWNNSTGNWTNVTGSINQSWVPGVGIFTGTAGVVTIAEPVSAMGLQFISDGYQVTSAGSGLTMVARPDGSMPFVRVDPGATADISAPIAGTAGLMKTDAGTLVLSGTNSYTGGTVISDGTLQLGNGGATGSIVGDITDDGALVFDRSGTLSIAGAISGSGTVTQAGPGTTVLTGANSYAGGTFLDAGILQVAADGNLGAPAGDLTFNGGTLQTTASFGTARNATLGPTGGVFQVDANTVLTDGGVISGAGALTKAGSGTLALSGTNSYAGGTFLDAGILQVAADGNLGAPEGGLTFNGGTLQTTASFGTARNATLGPTGGVFQVDVNTVLTDDGVISGAGALTKAGSGTLSLTGANIYTGTTTVAAGTLRINGSLATSPVTANAGSTLGGIGTLGGPVTITNGATLDAGPTAGAVGTLTMGALTLNAGSQLTYDLGEANVAGGPNNDLVQVNGNLTLGGVVNVNAPGSVLANTLLPGSYRLINYTGTLSGSAAIGSIPSGFATSQIQTVVPSQVNLIAVQNGVPVQFWDGADTTGNGVLDGGTGTWNNSTGNWTNVTGSINQSWVPGVGIFTGTAGVVTIAEPVSAMGLQFISDGYQVTSAGSGLTMVARPDGSMPFVRVDPGATADISAPIAGTAGLMKTDAGTLVLSGTNSYTGGTVISDGTLQLGNGGATGSIVGDITDDGALVFDRSGTLSIAGAISGSGTVTQAGPGTTVLTGANSYAGGTFLDAGILQVAADGNLGAPAGDLTFNGGTLQTTASFGTARNATLGPTGGVFQVDANTVLTDGGVISGAGALTKAGSGTLALSGTNSYAGGTFLDAGILQVAADGNLGAPEGGLTFNGGTLQTTASFGTARNATLGPTGGVFQVDVNTVLTDDGVISGAGALTKAGSGTLSLTGANIYTGTTTVAAGTLRINGSLATSPVTANAGSTLGGIGTLGGPVTITNGATLDAGPTAGAVGTLTMGALTLNAGSQLTYDLGEANVAGGPNNDLVQVNGNLTLGGVVNVNAPGSVLANTLLPGSYRLINYTGTLSGSAAIGSIPSGFATSQIQTVVPNQVNLIAVQNGVPVQFWDGADTTGNGVLDGGTGTWNNSTGNWTNVTGSINQSWVPGVGIFTGTAGVVTIAEPVSAMGLQFISDGYQVTSAGSGLTMVARPDGSMPFVRVDPGATADISAPIAGTAGLMKTDAGTLVLSGTNSYTGGTVISDGTLQLGNGGATGSIVGDITDDGALVFDRSGTLSIAGAISGSGTVTQAGPGTTVLTGANSYAGGTFLDAGILQVAADGNLGAPEGGLAFNGGTLRLGASFDLAVTRAVTLNASGGAIDTNGFSSTVAQPISGTGALTKAGAGILDLTGASTYTGPTTLQAGTLAVNGSISSPTTIEAQGILSGNGTIFGDVANAGTVAPGNSIGTLTVAGNYVGNNGRLALETVLAGDGAASDVLVLGGTNGGSATGMTTVMVNNAGGNGALTVSDGIKVVNAVDGATTAADAFALAGQFVTASRQQAVIGGAYGYTLHRGGVSAGTDVYGDTAFTEDWYLRSQLISVPVPGEPPAPQLPLYQPGVPIYESYAQVLLGNLNSVPTLWGRVGNRHWSGEKLAPSGSETEFCNPGLKDAQCAVIEGQAIWTRIEGSHGHFEPDASTSLSSFDADHWKVQAGLDGLLAKNDDGRLVGSLTVHTGRVLGNVWSVYGNGDIDSQGYGFGGALTWYGQNGFYVDGQAQATWYESDLMSDQLGLLTKGNDGFGYALSVEVGKRIDISASWTVTPQAQLVYSSIDIDNFTDPFGAVVESDDGDTLEGRVGLAAERQRAWKDETGKIQRVSLYGIANLFYEFLDGTTAVVSGTPFHQEQDRLWGGLSVGGTYNWADDKYSVYGEVTANTSLANFADSYAFRGTAGFRVKF